MSQKICMYRGCDAPATQKHLCRMHYTKWPYFRFLAGDPITQRRTRPDGYIDAMVDGIWALEHRLVMTREMGRLLETAEVVVANNGDYSDCRPENLRITDRKTLHHERSVADWVKFL
jgi:HNH endonuclease